MENNKKYILIADDEPLNQSVFREMLIDDYEIHIVGDGKQCLDSVEERIPDLLLLDISMPNMNGIEVCQKLREREDTKNLPIVLVSAYASADDHARGLAVGATDYVSKPFDITLFHERIRELISNQT